MYDKQNKKRIKAPLIRSSTLHDSLQMKLRSCCSGACLEFMFLLRRKQPRNDVQQMESLSHYVSSQTAPPPLLLSLENLMIRAVSSYLCWCITGSRGPETMTRVERLFFIWGLRLGEVVDVLGGSVFPYRGFTKLTVSAWTTDRNQNPDPLRSSLYYIDTCICICKCIFIYIYLQYVPYFSERVVCMHYL